VVSTFRNRFKTDFSPHSICPCLRKQCRIVVSSPGVGTWTSGTNYPSSEDHGSCVSYWDYIYCIAGLIFGDTSSNNQVYYSEIVHPPTTTVTVTGPTTTVTGPTTKVTGPTSTTTTTALMTTTSTAHLRRYRTEISKLQGH
jgi:hypothetical protein